MKLNKDNLIDIGFEKIGQWSLENCTIGYSINSEKEETIEIGNALYAFVNQDDVKYIGKTTKGINKRFVGYVNPGNSQATNRKCHDNIKELLENGKDVEIWAFTPTIPLQIEGFDINIAAGLEDSLINKFKPEWNGKNKLADDISDLVELPTQAEEQKRLNANNIQNIVYTFEITLGRTYYEQGFINVPGNEHEGGNIHLGADRESIQILLGNDGEYVDSKINRTANANGSVRIVGKNSEISRFFKRNFNLMEKVKADILDRNTIRLNIPVN